METEKQRTIKQNSCLHEYCGELAKALDEAGFEQREVFERFHTEFDVPWTKYAIKGVCQRVGFLMFGKKSTAELTTVEMQKVYEVVDKRISEITGIRVEWPNVDSKRVLND